MYETLLEILDELKQGVFIAEHGRIVYVNDACSKIGGYSTEELAALPSPFALVVPKKRALMLKHARRPSGGAKAAISTYETAMVHKSGRRVEFEVAVKPLGRDDERFLVMIRDITERKRAEEALRESESRFHLLAENAQGVVYRYRLGPNRGFEYVSPSVATVTGYTPEELYADPNLARKGVHPDDRRLLDDVAGSVAPPFDPPLMLRWRRKDGEAICLEHRCEVVRG